MTWLGFISFLRNWWKVAAGAAVMFAPAFFLGRCDGAASERAEIAAEKAEAERKAAEHARHADHALAARKQAVEAVIAGDRKELDNATAGIPDQALSDRQRARACAELRRTGRVDAACGPVRTAD